MKILITGASGFIGSFIVEEALRRGMDTWAAVRRSSSKKYLADERIHFIELNLDDEQELTEQLRGHEFDYVVHAAGVTKCPIIKCLIASMLPCVQSDFPSRRPPTRTSSG